MAVHLDATKYLQNAMSEDWGNSGTIFVTITPAWDYTDGVQHQLFVKAKAAFDGNGFLFAKGSGGPTYVGWLTGGTDYRLIEVGGVFGAGRTDNHLFFWNVATSLNQYWWNGTFRISSSTPFTVPTGLTHFTLGCLFNTTTSEPGNASYAEFGRWNRQLSNEDVAVLQATGCPLSVPNGLRQYHPLINPSISGADLMGHVPLTVVGGPTATAHPRVFYPSSGYVGPQPAAPMVTTLEPPLVSNAFQVFAPSVLIGAAPAEGTLMPPFVSSPFQVFAPSVLLGDAPAPPIGITTYPPVIDTAANLLIAANNKRSTIVGELTISGLELTVDDASTWPDSGAITLDTPIARLRTDTSNEIVYYNGKSGNTLRLAERGADDTTAKAWVGGSAVEFRHIAKHHNLHSEAIIALQTEVETKADTGHAHAIADVTGLQAQLDAKATAASVVAKSGDTMTGPLLLPGAPSLALHAATKSYVDGIALGASPGIYEASSYSASGSMVQTTGSITAGTPTLTVVNAASFVVGHGIFVAGAGSAGAAIVTTITAIAGTQFTLAANAAATVSNAVVQHDDSAAINAVMAAAVAGGGGTINFAPGFYRCNGPFTSAGSILAPPYISVTGGTPIAIRLKGVAPIPWFAFTGPHPTTGVVFQTDKVKANMDSSLFACAPYVPGVDFTVASNAVVYIEDIIFRTYDNPNINCLDLAMAGGIYLSNIWIDTGTTLLSISHPANTGLVGLRMPNANTPTGFAYADRVWVQGYDIGAQMAEPQGVSNILVLRCNFAYKMAKTFALCRAVLNTYQCQVVATITDTAYLDWSIHIENAPTGFWYSPFAGGHFYDPGNMAHGVVKYSSLRSETGAEVPISNTGATNLDFINLRA